MMPTWLRSWVNAFLGRVPGKTSRLDTATRTMINADFSLDRGRPRKIRPADIRTPVTSAGIKIRSKGASFTRRLACDVLFGRLAQRLRTAAMTITTSTHPGTLCFSVLR